MTISILANADIVAITDYIEQANGPAAERLGRQIYQACFSLSEFPDSYALAPGLEQLGIRRRGVGRYSVLYVARADDVLVLRVVHNARDYPKLFSDWPT